MNAAAKQQEALKNEPLYLIDGSSFIFRAFHALPPLTNPQGVPVNAVLGFANMLTKLLADHNAHSVAVIFDAARANFRNEIYDQYKANRGETPEDLIPQFPLIREAVQAFNLPCLELDGFEADDLIATYARLATEAGRKAIIVSSDKDLMQLVNDNVIMFDAMKNKHIGYDEVVEKFGVAPERVIDVQSLAGDSVDNIPGVPGIGVKTAALLINEYGDLETLLERAGEIKQNKRRENLINHKQDALMSKKLVSLDTHVPVPVSLEDLTLHEPDPEKLLGFLSQHGFRSTMARIESQLKIHANGRADFLEQAATAPEKIPYECIETTKQLQQWIDDCYEAGWVAIDTETTSLTPAKAKLVGISLSTSLGRACYIPLGHQTNNVETGFNFDNTQQTETKTARQQIPLSQALSLLKPLLEDLSVLKIAHNMKYDMQLFMKHGITPTPVDDTMLLSYVVDGTSHGHGLDELTETFLGHKNISFKEIAGTGKNQKTFDQIDIDEAIDYAAEDADMTLRLHTLFKPRLAEDKMSTIYEKYERPLIPVIAKMELKGIKVDPLILKQMSEEFGKSLETLEHKIFDLAGTSFNVASPKQMGEVLFDKLGLEGGKKSKTGVWSTAHNILEPLADSHEIIAHILEHRALSKLKSTYTDALQEQVNPETGRIHTSFSMAVTNTGRLSSSDPNLQNIPIKSEDGKKIRTAFIAEKDHKIVAIDYSQIELRLAAEMANIKALKEAFVNGQDIHALTAAQVMGVELNDVTSEMRRQAKAINFGIIYGISGFGLAKQLGCDTGEATQYIKQYLSRFPELEIFMNGHKEFAKKHGYVETLMGRKCVVNGINDKNFSVRSFAERQAINAPLQGTAADIIKKAMIEVDRTIENEDLQAKMLLQVHDELVFEIHEKDLDKTVERLCEIMENVVELSLPLKVEAGIGNNWAEAH